VTTLHTNAAQGANAPYFPGALTNEQAARFNGDVAINRIIYGTYWFQATANEAEIAPVSPISARFTTSGRWSCAMASSTAFSSSSLSLKSLRLGILSVYRVLELLSRTYFSALRAGGIVFPFSF